MDRISELKDLIQRAKDAYFNLSPIISDQQFDALVDELKQLDPKALEVTSVGAPPPQFSVWEKVRHEIPMGSLGKVNTESEFDKWINKMQAAGAGTFFTTHKIDGSSMELVYQAGKLIRCITRGDGIIGEDVTANMMKVPSIPKKLAIPVDVIVRGEVIMMKDVFTTKYADDYANPRNTAAGKVREKKGKGEACRDLEFLAYWVKFKNQTDQPKTMLFSVMWLESHGFKIPPCEATVAAEIPHIKTRREDVVKGRNDIPYEIDGIVISVNNLDLLENLGELNMRPNGQIAWKFDHEMRESRMVDVKWQVGLTGRICPVAVVEPVQIGGVTITNISLHNLRLFNHLKLFRGCVVLISRRNDVIPYCERNVSLGIDANMDV